MNMNEIPYFPQDVMQLLGFKHAHSLYRAIKAGKVPEPDVKLTQKTRYWHRHTLEQAGLLAKANQPTPAT